MSPEEARELLSQAPGIKIVDDPKANHFPMPLEASGDLDVHVGRIRRDLSNPNGLVLFAAGDQLLKGAAWNAVQIAEELAKLAVARCGIVFCLFALPRWRERLGERASRLRAPRRALSP